MQLEIAALSLTQSGKLFQTLSPDTLSYRLVLTYEVLSTLNLFERALRVEYLWTEVNAVMYRGEQGQMNQFFVS